MNTQTRVKNGGAKRLPTKSSSATRAVPGATAANEESTTNPVLSENEIATRAYEIWQERWCPEGCDEEIWLQAEEELTRNRDMATAS